jgi:VWFA-related protein
MIAGRRSILERGDAMNAAGRTWLAGVAVTCALTSICAARENDKPKNSGLVEKAGSRLVQIDLSVTRRDGSPVDIQPGDLEVRVGKSTIRDFALDRICSPAMPATPAAPTTSTRSSTPAIASYLFYFDEPHMTYAGRARALDVARELVRTLIVGGNRAMVISNGRDLLALSGLTSDPVELLGALNRLQNDTSRQDNYAELEYWREDRLAWEASDQARRAKSDERFHSRSTEGNNLDPITGESSSGRQYQAGPGTTDQSYMANAERSSTLPAWGHLAGDVRELQRDELWRAQSALERFRLALLRFAAVRAPKAVVYFADNLRLNAGEHYVRTVYKAMEQEGAFRSRPPGFGGIRDVEGYFERAIAMAGSVGARVYAVQAAGMSADSMGLRDAKDALSSLALETGGKAFLEGISMAAIAGTISRDMECLYLVSFEPKALPQDQPLPVRIAVNRADAVVRARSQIVIPSEKAMVEARRLAAFLSPRANGAALTLGIVPVGFDGKKYSEMFQLAIPDGGPAGSTWTVSASIIDRGRVVQEFDRNVTARRAGQPLIVEHLLDLSPGTYSVVAVAENTTLNILLSGQIDVVAPEAEKDGASVTAPVALQPQSGWFVRDDGAPRPSGSLVRVEGEPLQADLPTALVGYVCRGKGEKSTLQIERQLVGQTAVTFPPIALEPGGDPCAQVRDVIPAATLGDGSFQYVVTVLRGEELLAKAQRQVSVTHDEGAPTAPR